MQGTSLNQPDDPINRKSAHCTENHIFFFRTSWKDGLSKKIAPEYDLSCIIGKDDIYFSRKYDPTRYIWSYTKMKDDLSKKTHENMIFYSSLLKRWSFQKGPRRHMIFLVLSEKMIFFPRKHDLFSLGRKRKTVLLRKYMETWCIAQRRKTENLIYRAEVWPLLKFIGLEIFCNE